MLSIKSIVFLKLSEYVSATSTNLSVVLLLQEMSSPITFT